MKPPQWQHNEAYRKEFDDLIGKHFGMMFNTAHRITQNRHDAQDVVQSVLLRLNQGPPPGSFIQSPAKYLRQASYHAAVSFVRSRNAQRTVDEEVSELEIMVLGITADRIARIMDVRSALKAIKPAYAEVLRLAYMEDMSCPEIADLLGKGLGAVWMELHRARIEFKKQYRMKEEQREAQKGKHQRPACYGVPGASEA